ncbi:hypothetical protein [Rhodococcus sp. NCIMB 12038]|uniref:hypothetical protein n=1 Tax=Rhodococcus sp. NCIMB 12038 TaxID=933800 RepID=UPI00117AB3C1|nr:hypothetical protein [Rhodococcus sp. NCIMB 12038]
MRRTFCVAAVLMSAVTLGACSSGDDSGPTQSAEVAPSMNSAAAVPEEPRTLKPGDSTGISLGSTRGTVTLQSVQTDLSCGSGGTHYQAVEFTVDLDPGTSYMTAGSLELTEILPDGTQSTSPSNVTTFDCLAEDQPQLESIRHGSTQRGWIVAKTQQPQGSFYFHTDSQNYMDTIIEF